MANYVVSDTNLTLIADAIRAKSGHNELLEWPNEYKTSIDNLNPVDMCIKTATDNIVSVSDAAQYDAKNATIKIEPVQDLHGYDSPWPAGGGKNMLPDITGARTTNSIFIGQADGTTYPIYLEANTAYSVSVIANSGAIGIQVYIKENGGSNIVFANGASGTYTPTQNMNVQMWVYAEGLTSVSQFQLEKGSTPTAWTPYSNICPITGWTGANVTRTGKNLLPFEDVFEEGWTNTLNGITATYSNGIMRVVGTSTSTGFTNIVSFKNVWLNNPISFSAGNYVIPNNLVIQLSIDGAHFVNMTGAFTMEESLSIKGFYIAVAAGKTVDWSIPMMFVSGTTTPTAYEPYQGDTYDITFPSSAGTVYGGTLDLTAGTLTVDRVMWTKNTSTMDNGEKFPGWRNAGVAAIVGTGVLSNIITVANIGSIISINTNGSNDILYLERRNYGRTEAEWKALAIDVQVVLPLTALVTYDLTPQDIALLRGNNTLWADTGDTTLKYFTTAFEDLAEEIGFAEGGGY